MTAKFAYAKEKREESNISAFYRTSRGGAWEFGGEFTLSKTVGWKAVEPKVPETTARQILMEAKIRHVWTNGPNKGRSCSKAESLEPVPLTGTSDFRSPPHDPEEPEKDGHCKDYDRDHRISLYLHRGFGAVHPRGQTVHGLYEMRQSNLNPKLLHASRFRACLGQISDNDCNSDG